MNDLIDIFYKDIQDIIKNYQTSVVQKEFVNKSGEIELIPINLAKGEITAAKQLDALIASLYKKYKTDLNANR